MASPIITSQTGGTPLRQQLQHCSFMGRLKKDAPAIRRRKQTRERRDGEGRDDVEKLLGSVLSTKLIKNK